MPAQMPINHNLIRVNLLDSRPAIVQVIKKQKRYDLGDLIAKTRQEFKNKQTKPDNQQPQPEISFSVGTVLKSNYFSGVTGNRLSQGPTLENTTGISIRGVEDLKNLVLTALAGNSTYKEYGTGINVNETYLDLQARYGAGVANAFLGMTFIKVFGYKPPVDVTQFYFGSSINLNNLSISLKMIHDFDSEGTNWKVSLGYLISLGERISIEPSFTTGGDFKNIGSQSGYVDIGVNTNATLIKTGRCKLGVSVGAGTRTIPGMEYRRHRGYHNIGLTFRCR